MAAFRSFVLGQYGGADAGIIRACEAGGASEHKEGRAWDWAISATNPEEAARAESLIAWLLADGQANFRRIGLMYLIWNGRKWSTKARSWEPYTGADPHTTHVHFSFGWPGARGETSFFAGLRGPDAFPLGGTVALFVGAVVGWSAVRRWT